MAGYPLAVEFKKENKSYRDDRIMIDASNNNPELETIHPQHAMEDWTIYAKHITDTVKNNPPTLTELTKQLVEVDKRIAVLVDTQVNTQRQLEMFIKANTPKDIKIDLGKPDYYG